VNKVVLKTNQNPPPIRAYKEAVEKGLQSHHVLPRGNEWIVKRAGASKATAVYSTQSDAINKGRSLSSNNNSELFIHGRDGRIRERI